MSGGGHTPGPWKTDGPRITSARGAIAHAVPHEVAPNRLDMGTAMADARLISAAPDMLAALREAADVLDAECAPGERFAVQDRIDKAIRKATGGDA